MNASKRATPAFLKTLQSGTQKFWDQLSFQLKYFTQKK